MDQNPPALQKVKQQTIKGQLVMLDGMHFEECRFEKCTIRYFGGPSFLLSCTFGPNLMWDFQGQAAQVIQTLQAAGWRLEYGKPGADSPAIPLTDNPKVQ
jgi:hypothetical protein